MSAATTTASSKTSKSSSSKNLLEQTAIELFKYCKLYNGDGNAYWNYDEQLLVPYRDIIQKFDVNYAVQTQQQVVVDDDKLMHDSFLSISPYNPAKYELSTMIRILLETSNEVLVSNTLLLSVELHRLIIDKKENDHQGSSDMVNNAAKIGIDNVESNDIIEKNDDRGTSSWTLLYNTCIPLADLASASLSGVNNSDGEESYIANDGNFDTDHSAALEGLVSTNVQRRVTAHKCPRSKGGYCCITFLPDENKGITVTQDASSGGSDNAQLMPVMALHHPLGGRTSSQSGERHSKEQKMPYKLHTATGGTSKQLDLKLGGVPESDLPYISTVRLVRNNTIDVHYQSTTDTKKALKFPTHPVDMPNFFDILFENDCLPYSR